MWEAKLRGIGTEEVREMYLADTPLGWLPGVGEFADAVAFLVSDDARFITGEALGQRGCIYGLAVGRTGVPLAVVREGAANVVAATIFDRRRSHE